MVVFVTHSDLIDRLLLFYYTMSAHGMTRGTMDRPGVYSL